MINATFVCGFFFLTYLMLLCIMYRIAWPVFEEELSVLGVPEFSKYVLNQVFSSNAEN